MRRRLDGDFPYTLSEAIAALREGVWLVDKERVKEQLLTVSLNLEMDP